MGRKRHLTFDEIQTIEILKQTGLTTDRLQQKYLESELIPYLEDVVSGGNFLFMQDNAAVHVSKFSMNWFQTSDIPVLQ